MANSHRKPADPKDPLGTKMVQIDLMECIGPFIVDRGVLTLLYQSP